MRDSVEPIVPPASRRSAAASNPGSIASARPRTRSIARPSRTTSRPSLNTNAAWRNVAARSGWGRYTAMSARPPGARWPRSASPSRRAGAARVMVAISGHVYSLAREGRAQTCIASAGTVPIHCSRSARLISRANKSGYAVNGAPFGWSVVKKSRHGSSMSRNSSSPAAHCTALKKLVRRYRYGTTPPPLPSPSMMTDFRGCACARPLNWRIKSHEIVTVCPNITCPTSAVTFGFALTASARRGAAEEKPRAPSVP